MTGVDPNPEMQPYAHETAELAFQQVGDSLELLTGTAEELPLADESVDAAVCTLVLCSVNNVHKVRCTQCPHLMAARSNARTQQQVLAEVRRVLRPGGCFAFLEHVYAPPERPGLRVTQTLLNPLQKALADGCHLTRDTVGDIGRAGFSEVDVNAFDVSGLTYLSTHASGVAVK